MRTISSAVEDMINGSPFLKELVILDVVNLSGLARQLRNSIEEETKKEVSEGAILVALKRHTQKMNKNSKINPTVFSMTPELTVRSNLFEINAKNSPTLMDKQRRLVTYAKKQQNHFLTFTYGVFETTTIASNKMYETIKHIYQGELVVSEVKNISTISIKFPIEIFDSPFVYYRILRTLCWSGISIIEMVSTYSELTLALDQKDVELAFSLIRKLFSTSSKEPVSQSFP